MSHKVQHNKNYDSFAAQFAQHFDQKRTPQQCCEIMNFEILSKVNPIGSMKTWSKSSCTLCIKERLEIVSRSQRSYGKLIKPVQKYMEHVVITRCSIGLPGTDDPLKVKESPMFLRIRI